MASLESFSPINNDSLLNKFKVRVDVELPNSSNTSLAIYRVTISYSPKNKEWFVLQHYSGFERLLKFLKKSDNHKTLLKRYGIKNLPKKPNLFSGMFSNNPDFLQGVTSFVNAIFSETTFLKIEEVQIFFAMDKHVNWFKDLFNVNDKTLINSNNHQSLHSLQSFLNNSNHLSTPVITSNNSAHSNYSGGHTTMTSSASSKYSNKSNKMSQSQSNDLIFRGKNGYKSVDTNNNSVKHGNNLLVNSSLTTSGISSQMSGLKISNDTASTHSSKDSYNRGSGSIPTSPTNWNLAGTLNRQVKPSDFEFLKVIGKGSYGKVLLAQDRRTKSFYAVKVLNKQTIINKNEQYHIMAERNVLSKNLSHPFLVSLHYSFQTPEKLYFVLDYANGGELFFHLQKEKVFSEVRARFYAAEIGSAIGYMHTQDILYRDLKPENLLLDRSGHIVLTDFGLCKEFISTGDTTQTFCGTPEYLAPEVIKKQPYSKAIDWWCFGAVLYEMLYGLPPFYSRNMQEMYTSIINSPLIFKRHATADAKDLLIGLLQKNPEKRLGTGHEDFDEIKKHVFFQSINWDDLLNKRIEPPFKPQVANETDLSMIDRTFRDEPLPNSVIDPITATYVEKHQLNRGEEFVGFSYVRPSASEFFDEDTTYVQ